MSKTKTHLSSISYNTAPWLQKKLKELINNGTLDFWCYIYHYGETNEDGSKERNHFHLFLVPAVPVDCRQLRNEFIEFTRGEKLPRGLMPIRPNTKWDDWYLYDLHDKEYLFSKGQSREYHYSDIDMVRSDDTYYWDSVHRIDRTKINPLGEVIRAAQSGITFEEFVTTHPLSLLQVRSAQFVFQQVSGKLGLHRAGRPDHEPVDPDTGEYISPVDIKE